MLEDAVWWQSANVPNYSGLSWNAFCLEAWHVIVDLKATGVLKNRQFMSWQPSLLVMLKLIIKDTQIHMSHLNLQLLPFLPSTPFATSLQLSMPTALIWSRSTWSSWKKMQVNGALIHFKCRIYGYKIMNLSSGLWQGWAFHVQDCTSCSRVAISKLKRAELAECQRCWLLPMIDAAKRITCGRCLYTAAEAHCPLVEIIK